MVLQAHHQAHHKVAAAAYRNNVSNEKTYLPCRTYTTTLELCVTYITHFEFDTLPCISLCTVHSVSLFGD